MSESIIPVIAGLAAGITLIITFSLASFQPSGLERVAGLPAKEIVWVVKDTTQCDDPWYREQTSVIDYFADRQIQIHDMDESYFLKPDQRVCAGCDCISGLTVYLAVDASNAPEMQKYGFASKLD